MGQLALVIGIFFALVFASPDNVKERTTEYKLEVHFTDGLTKNVTLTSNVKPKLVDNGKGFNSKLVTENYTIMNVAWFEILSRKKIKVENSIPDAENVNDY